MLSIRVLKLLKNIVLVLQRLLASFPVSMPPKVIVETIYLPPIEYIYQFANMEYFEYKKSRTPRFLLEEPSSEEYIYVEPVEKKASKNVHEQFNILYVARDRFLGFVESLGYLRNTEIREDILTHCEQNTKKERVYSSFMNDQTILKIMNLRIDKMIKNKRIKKNWSEQDVQILIWVISKYSDLKRYQDLDKDIDDADWQAIASLIPGVTGESCMFKWLSLKKINLATNNWSQEQSNILSQLVNQKGHEGKHKDSKDWKLISQKVYILNPREDKIFRNAKQCREHWNCYLNPSLKKGPWKQQEDIQLLKCIKQNRGSKKWSQIVKYFDGRTQNALKNRYTLIIEKQKKYNRHKTQLQIIEEYLVRSYVDQFTTQINPQESQGFSDSLQKIMIKEQYDQESDEEPESMKNEEQERRKVIQTPATPVTPIKIQRFCSFQTLSKIRLSLNDVKFGFVTQDNNFFQKNDVVGQKTCSQIKLKRYNSSMV